MIVRTVFAMLFSCLLAMSAMGQQVRFSAGFIHQGSQLVQGNGWFGSNGGRADVAVSVTRHMDVVAEFSGVHTGNMASSNMGLTLLTYMTGPRLSFNVRQGSEAGRLTLFSQVLLGGVHATEGAFPQGATLRNTASSFAMATGGGLDVSLRRRFSLRPIQMEYLYTRLPNLSGNRQNSYRIGAGVVLRLR